MNMIFSNRGQRQERTAFEKLEEAKRLEPIARKIFDEEKAKGNITGNFRKFFAEEALSISSSALQRLKTLEKLIPEAKQAVDDGKISETAAAEIATMPEEAQRAYLSDIDAGIATGTVADVKSNKQDDDDDTTVDNHGNDNTASHDNNSGGEEKEDKNTTTAPVGRSSLDSNSSAHDKEDSDGAPASSIHNSDPAVKTLFARTAAPAPIDLSGDAAEKEADSWVVTALTEIMKMAESKMIDATNDGNSKAAAQWDLRRAKANLVIETIKD